MKSKFETEQHLMDCYVLVTVLRNCLTGFRATTKNTIINTIITMKWICACLRQGAVRTQQSFCSCRVLERVQWEFPRFDWARYLPLVWLFSIGVVLSAHVCVPRPSGFHLRVFHRSPCLFLLGDMPTASALPHRKPPVRR